jgi:uncharacterized protein
MSQRPKPTPLSNAAGALGAWPLAGGGRQPRLTLNLTHACNMACTYCYAGEKSASAMGAETGRAAIDLALAALARRSDPALLIAFFGGEPLIAWGRLVDLAEYAVSAAPRAGATVRFQVTTNGTLLTPERLEILAGLGAEVAISVDGVPAAHDAARPMAGGRPSAARVWEALDLALERLPHLSVISVVDPSNVVWLGDSIAALADRGVQRLVLNGNYTAAWPARAREAWRAGYERAAEVYLASYRHGRPLALNVFDDKILLRLRGAGGPLHGCGFGEWDLAVAPSGRLYPCGRAVGADRDESLALGDVARGLTKAVSAPARTPADLPEPCRECAHHDRCGSRCGCANREMTGDARLPAEVLCWHERMSIPIADRVASTLFGESNDAFMTRFYGIPGRAV